MTNRKKGRFSTVFYSLKIDGVKYYGGAQLFTEMYMKLHNEACNKDKIAYRLREFAKGRLTAEQVLQKGKLNGTVRYIPTIKEVVCLHKWILRKERWPTVKLKWLYLDLEPSAYMNQVRQ